MTEYLTPEEWPTFLKAYKYMAGESEIPSSYHLWCAVAIMGASLARRVWTTKGHMKIYPNLYTYLLGPSANGKSAAINLAHKLLIEIPDAYTAINPVQGSASNMGLFDFAGVRVREGTDAPEARSAAAPIVDKAKIEEALPIFWVCPELANSMGNTRLAKSMIYMLTDLYEGHETIIQDIKRGSGHVLLKAPIVNWLAGSTVEWFIDAVPASVMEGGFVGRVVMVEEGYSSKRYLEPITPPNTEDMRNYLQRFLYHFMRIEGEISLTQEAMEADETWYLSRKQPASATLIPGWRRQHDLARKLAMLLSIGDPDEWHFADEFPFEPPVLTFDDGTQGQLSHVDAWWSIPGKHSMKIKAHHMMEGHRLSYAALRFATRLTDKLDSSRHAKLIAKIADMLEKDGELTHTYISNKMGGGTKRTELSEAYIALQEAGKIKVSMVRRTSAGRPTKVLTWIGTPTIERSLWNTEESMDEEIDYGDI